MAIAEVEFIRVGCRSVVQPCAEYCSIVAAKHSSLKIGKEVGLNWKTLAGHKRH